MHPNFKPMLSAKDFDAHHLTYPVLVSDKYDGIRNCQLPDLGGVSRKLEPIPNLKVREYFNRPELMGLDGELCVGDPTQEKHRGKVMAIWSTINGPGVEGGAFKGSTKDHPDYGPVTFYVFDDFYYPERGKFDRYSGAAKRVKELNDPHIKLIEQKLVWNAEQLIAAFKDAEARGFEGIMVADLDGIYKFGRESVRYDRKLKKEGVLVIPEMLLGKVKSFEEEEGTIDGFEEEMENLNEKTTDALGHSKRSKKKENMVPKGRLGAFWVTNPKYAKRFKVSASTIPHDERVTLWNMRESLLGKQLTYSFQPSGMDQVPQFTTFMGIRED